MSATKMDAVVMEKKCGTADGGVHFPVGFGVITVKAFFRYLSWADILYAAFEKGINTT